MIYLLIEVFALSSTDLLIARCKRKGYDGLHYSLATYIASVLCPIIQICLLFSNGTREQLAYSNMSFAVGIAAGLFYVSNFLLKQLCTARHGAAITAMFTRLCMIVSVLFAVIVFKDHASTMRWIGFFLAIAALFVYNYGAEMKVDKYLILLLFANGFSQVCNNIFSRLCPGLDQPVYAIVANGIAMCIIIVRMLQRDEKVKWGVRELLLGLLNGSLCFVCLTMQLKALTVLPSSLVFPFTAVAVILLTSIGSRVFFGERFSKNTLVAFGITIAALLLMNM